MESLYQIAINPDIDLHTRYDAVRVMQHMRETDPTDYIKLQEKRRYQDEYNQNRWKKEITHESTICGKKETNG